MKKQRKFKKIYYVIQTFPRFQICGYAFSKTTAKFISDKIYQLTGETGHIVEFTRKQLQELGFKSYGSKNLER